eukprot:scaffold9696_cov112-Isochrysis_galbana.AAC.6
MRLEPTRWHGPRPHAGMACGASSDVAPTGVRASDPTPARGVASPPMVELTLTLAGRFQAVPAAPPVSRRMAHGRAGGCSAPRQPAALCPEIARPRNSLPGGGHCISPVPTLTPPCAGNDEITVSKDSIHILKHHGSYMQQNRDLKKKSDREASYQFMLRLK